MKVVTVPGQTYVVYAAEGSTITAPGVKDPLLTCEGGKPNYVTVPGGEMEISDPEATYAACRNFKGALAALGLLGGGKSELPRGFQRAEFLEARNSSTVTTFPFSYKTEDTVRVEWSTERTLSEGTDYLRVFGGATTYGGLGPDGNDPDETKHKRFRSTSILQPTSYVQSLFIFNDTFQNFKVYNDGRKNINIISKDNAIVNGVTRKVVGAYDIDESPFSFPGWGHGWAIGLRVFLFDQRSDTEVKTHLIPAISSSGRPCMFDSVSKQPFYNSGSGEFIVGLTLRQARNFWHKLPATGGSLTISLPEGYEADAAVVESLARAAARGWVLTIQTYTPEGAAAAAARTWGFRRIWVRKREDENGSYVAADGSRWQVEWCVDVVGSSPEDEGYEPFRSREAAVAYWELVPWVDPEAMDEAMGDNGTLMQGGTSNTSPETNS